MKSALAVLAVLYLSSFIDARVIKCIDGDCQEKCSYPIDLAILLESSSMISKQDWSTMKNMSKNIVDAFDISEEGTHVAVMSYSTTAKIATSFDKYTGEQLNAENIKRDIDGMALMGGKQNLDIGLTQLNQKVLTAQAGMRPGVPKILVVATTGIQNYNDHPVTQPLLVAHAIKTKGFEVYSIGVGYDIDVMHLIQISSRDDNVMSIRYVSTKKEVMDLVKNKCQGPSIES